MQSKVIRADYRHDNSSSMKKRLLRTKKTTEDRPTPADADSIPLVIYLFIVDFYCSGNFISVLFGLKVGELGSDKMAATNQPLLFVFNR